MTLPTIDQARSWRGMTLVATDNEPVGRIEAIYVDRTTRQPEWALVLTGLFGSARTFVPLADATQRGDIVRVPHETSVVRAAPRLEQDAELSEEDEARLYAHYGIGYTTDESSSGLPVGVPGSPDGGTAPAATDATTELPPTSSRLQADAPTAAGVDLGTGQTVTTPGDDAAGGGRRKQVAAAGIGAVALAAAGAGVAARRRRRPPPSLGERVGQAGREAVDALAQAAEEVRRQAVAVTSGDGARQSAKPSRKAARKASRAGQDAVDAGLRAAQVALAAGLAAVEDSRRAARKAARKAAEAGQEASEGGRRAAKAAAAGGVAAAEGGRRAAKRARKEAAAAAAAAEATVESKRRAAKRAQEKAAAATAGAARSVAAAPAAAGRRAQKADAGKQAKKVTQKRRRRSKMKGMGKLGMVVGAAVGYVLGAKAGRERYDQITASARQLLDNPQVKRVVDSAPGDLGARLEQVANKAADKVHEAGDKVAATGSGTTGATTGTTTTTTTPAAPSTSGTSASTTTPSVPSTSDDATTTRTTKRSSAASERKPKST